MRAAVAIRLAEQIDHCLPQTQCTRCGYPRCRLYAEAVARGEADINRCPPGGEATIAALARLLDVPPKALDPACGSQHPRVTALIDEAACIGCTLCLQACPVDAIVGATRQLHTVIVDECTGCELCVAPCPVDCIRLVSYQSEDTGDDSLWPQYPRVQVARARRRAEARVQRLGRRPREHSSAEIRRYIEQAVARVRAKKARRNG